MTTPLWLTLARLDPECAKATELSFTPRERARWERVAAHVEDCYIDRRQTPLSASGTAERSPTYKFANGSEIVLQGLDSAHAIMSSEPPFVEEPYDGPQPLPASGTAEMPPTYQGCQVIYRHAVPDGTWIGPEDAAPHATVNDHADSIDFDDAHIILLEAESVWREERITTLKAEIARLRAVRLTEDDIEASQDETSVRVEGPCAWLVENLNAILAERLK